MQPTHHHAAARRDRIWIAALAVVSSVAAYGLAWPARAGYSDSADDQKPREVIAAEDAIDSGNYTKAIEVLQPFVRENPASLDGLTDLGLAYLRTGNTTRAIAVLEKSLAQDSTKLDTNQVLGEAYLAAKNLSGAEAQLHRLDDLCFFGCSEERDLRAAIEKFKAMP